MLPQFCLCVYIYFSMYTNYFADFSKFFRESYQYPKTLTQKYLGQNFYWDGSQFPITNPGGVRFTNAKGDKTFLQASTFIGIDPKFAKELQSEPKDSDIVPVVIGNKADPKIKTQSDTAHGEPSEAGGETFEIPYGKFRFLIQMPQAAGGGGAPMGGPPMGGGGGGAPPMGGAPAGGGAPMGGPPMGGGGGAPPMGGAPAGGGAPPM